MKNQQLVHWASLVLAIAGSLFKMMHWSGANLMISLALLFLLVSVWLNFQANKSNGIGTMSNVLFNGFQAILILSYVSIIYHLSIAESLKPIAHILFVAIPVFVLVFDDSSKLTKGFWITYTIYILMVINMMAGKIHHMDESQDMIEQPIEQMVH